MKRAAAATLVFLVTRGAYAADDAVPGAISTPYPTLQNISIEWAITGDDDFDASVAVRYREAGATAWQNGLPLFHVPAGTNQGFSWAHRFAGSVFGVTPATSYEVELSLVDPDGGGTTEVVTVTTREVPVAAPSAPEISVTPATIDRAVASASPGDVLVLENGAYGEIIVPTSGAAGQPIVLRPATPGQAVVEGDVRLDGQSHVIVEDLVVHGMIKFNDAESITIRGCTIETQGDGIVSYGSGVRNALITDNTITGATSWYEGALGVDGDNIGEGVVLTGSGNVISFNRVSGFRDCLSLLEDSEAVEQISIDFYGNDLDDCADDAIEADFAMGNVRVYKNRVRDSFMGLSSQPSLGGPTYFFRNVMYNVLFQAFKLQRSSVGDLLLHNTIVKSGDAFSVNTSDVFYLAASRNNLFIGGPGGTYNGYDSGPGNVMDLPSADPASCSFDYDGFGSIGTGTFQGNVGGIAFGSLSEMQALTSEAHGLEVDLSVFEASVAFPSDPFGAPATPPMLLSASGGAIDMGVPLDNVSDGFSGAAPDLGAVELGAEEPVYGPGGTLGTGGTGGTGGESSGQTGGAGGGASSGVAGGDPALGGDGADDDGCGCRVTGAPAAPARRGLFLCCIGAFAWLRLRRRASRSVT